MPATRVPLWPSIRRLLELSGRHRYWFYTAAAMALLNALFTLASNFTLARFIDAVIARNGRDFTLYLSLTIGIVVATIPLEYLRALCVGAFSERTMAVLRDRIALQATQLPMRYLEERHTGDLIAIVNADLAKLRNITASGLLDIVSMSVMGSGALVALLVISWPLTVAALLLTPLMFVVSGRLNQPITRRAEEMQKAIGDTVSVAADGLGGLMVTKAFNLAAIIDERFQQANQRVVQKGLALTRLRAAADGSGAVFGVLPFLLTFGFGGFLAINGMMTFGTLLAFVNLLNFVANPISALPGIVAAIGEASGAVQRTYQMLDQPRERSGGASFAPADQSAIRFEHVRFAYDKEEVLRDFTLSVERGQTVAIVGPSGGGKSTVLKLLLGFYPLESPQSALYLFEHDLREWSLRAARRQMSFVAQDTYLFPVSVAENIGCGKPGAGPAEIEQAARLANIHDAIAALPDGYRTLAGERGARLSGGQRQRIALARAILKDAPILLLDEPTSALDTESEALVQEALNRFMRGRTTIVVAHRLTTIRDADVVVVLEDGRIVEQGSHGELIARAGRYRELYLRQFNAGSLAA